MRPNKLVKWLMIVVVVAYVGPSLAVHAGEFSVSLGSDYEAAAFTAVFSPDPNGGIGLMGLTDSYVPDDTEDNLALGPYVQFNLGDIAVAAADRVIPGSWPSFSNAPARLYGTMSFLWELDGEHDFVFAPGIKTMFFPKWRVRPCLRNTYFKPTDDDSLIDEDFKTMLEFDYRF